MTALPRLPPRAPDSHKGTYGRALLIGGSTGMAGAIALSGMAALRSGAGLVQLAVPAPSLHIVAAFEPSYLTTPLPADPLGRVSSGARGVLDPLLALASAAACGPGLGQSPELTDLVCGLYTDYKKPLVLDADALNALATRAEVLAHPAAERILTPHPGEFARLAKADIKDTQHRDALAQQLAASWQAVVLLKGHHTLISDGRQSVHNITGNPGMATGGTGDVLTGIITALLGQGLSAFDAARLGAYVHGLAGDLAAAAVGQVSLIASDLITYLPAAFQEIA